MMSNLTFPTIPVSLPPVAHQQAKQNAAQQLNEDQRRSAYLRTLAIYAVDHYLRCLNIETDLEESDLWNGLYGMLSDSANLDLPGIGQLECCPVLPGEDSFAPPQMTGSDCIAYVAVQFKSVPNDFTDIKDVELVGYRPILDVTTPTDEIFIDEFQGIEMPDDTFSLYPIEHLLQHLYWIEDIREGLKTAPGSVMATIQQWLDEKAYSVSQFAVQVVSKLQGCEPDLALGRTQDLLTNLLLGRDYTSFDYAGANLGHNLEMELSTENQVDKEEVHQQEAKANQASPEFLEWVQQTLKS